MDISGILLLDKPARLSSNEALHKARRMLGADKAGHAGTLDPLATGVLPLAFGEATKTCAFLLESDKSYRTRAQLGTQTDTMDADGEVIASASIPELSKASIEAVLAQFRGSIEQTPPMYSAIKHQGTALYALARQGIEVERTARTVQIHRLELLDFGTDWFELDVECGKGTYIRSLVADIAERLGTLGHVTELRRLWVAPFDNMPMYTLDQLGALTPPERRALLQAIDAGIVHLPILTISAERIASYLQAQRFTVSEAPGLYRVYGEGYGLLAIGEVRADQLLGVVRMLTFVPQIPNPNRRKRNEHAIVKS
jgi:tRNA pseudouridine55 synthase